MKRTATFFVLALLVLTLCAATAGASSSAACNLKINQFTVHPATGVAPAKIGFTTYMAGHVTRVRYTVMNSTTGKTVATCSSYCAHCTKKDICTCSAIIKQPGTYDVKVTAYGTGNCHVEQTKKSAVTVTAAKLIPNFKSTVSKKRVTFKDTSIGAAKWTWNFGDGSKSTAHNPTHVYKKAGTYSVSLTVYNAQHTSYKSVSHKVIVK